MDIFKPCSSNDTIATKAGGIIHYEFISMVITYDMLKETKVYRLSLGETMVHFIIFKWMFKKFDFCMREKCFVKENQTMVFES